MRFWAQVMILALGWVQVSAQGTVEAVALDNTGNAGDCLACHQVKTPALVQAWRDSVHSRTQPVADCVSCHGQQHSGSLARARQDQTCLHCHGEDTPLVHSYRTSKHGVIVRLEHLNADRQQPLQGANYRAPGCAYCHLYGGNHAVGQTVRADKMDSQAGATLLNSLRPVCQNCHSSRYIKTLFDNGEAMLELGRMKLREAQPLMAEARLKFTPQQLVKAEAAYREMHQHLRNVGLGVGHQSPDYQWWHGHPALDGDLLRIKGALAELLR